MTGEPMTASIAVQISPILRYNSGATFDGDLAGFAEQLTHYLAENLKKFTDPRSADLFIGLTVVRGGESAGHEFRSGAYVKDGG